MAKCSKCGFETDGQRPPPPRCPRCGAQTGVGAPPPFAGPEDPMGAPPSGSTIFGLPGVDADELTAPLGEPGTPPKVPPKVGPPPTAGAPKIAAGLPEIDFEVPPDDALDTLDLPEPAPDPGRHNEIDLSENGPVSAEGLELDTRRDGGHLGEVSNEADDPFALDLPLPPSPSPPAGPSKAPIPPPPPNPAVRVDTPEPPSIGAGAAPAAPEKRAAVPPPPAPFDLSVVDSGPGEDLDLPTPVELDLPAPAQPKPPPARRAAGARIPAAPEFGKPPADDLDLPAPVELDLPTPADVDLPAPADADLLQPANMEVQPTGMDIQPSTGMEVEPSDLNVTPADVGVRPKHPRDLPRPAGGELAPKGSASAAAAEASDLDADPLAARRSPVPKALPRPKVSRGLLYVGGGLIAVAIAGAGVSYSGVLEPTDDPSASRGSPAASDNGDGGVPDGPIGERSEGFMAKLLLDTPDGYAKAIEEAQAAGDTLGEAEAALLLHLRYGPDPVSAGKASALVEPYAAQDEPQVRRVVGLDALVRARLDEADQALTGEAPRATLYRGWLRLAQARPQDALAEAEAVLTEQADDLAAMTLRYRARLALDREGLLEAIEEGIAAHPAHPGLREVAAEAALSSGMLAKAREHAQALEIDDAMLPAYRARVEVLRGQTLAASGEHAAALEAFDRALELAPAQLATQLARVRTLIDAKQLAQAAAEIGAVTDAHADSVEAALLQAEVSIASGKADQALEQLTKLEQKLPDNAQVAYLMGETHAMNLAIEDAKAAYAKARDRDPPMVLASIGEARMLAHARQPVEAVAVLDGARAALAEPDASAVAALMLEKARLLEDQRQTVAAIAALDEALEAVPNHNDAQLMRGLLRLRQGEAETGRSDLMAVYARTGTYSGLTGPLGRLLAADGNVGELENLVGERAAVPQASIETKLVGARLRLLQGRLEDAKVLLEQALAREPSHWEAHLLLARSMLEAGDAAAALTEIERVRPKDPVAELHLLRGQILEYNNRHDDAAPEYLAALEIDPNLHEARMWYGRLLALKGANKQATVELGKVTEATGEAFPRAWLNLGRAQRELGNTEAALENLHKATTLDSTLYEGFYLEGRLQADKNRHEQAIEAFEKAVVDEASSEWWYANAVMDLGRSQVKSGKPKVARATFEKFLSVAPQDHAGRREAERQLKSLR